MSESKHDTAPVKVGELITILNGLKIEMSSCQQAQATADGQLRMSTSAPTPLGTALLGIFYYCTSKGSGSTLCIDLF
jgi:hypothetical protein